MIAIDTHQYVKLQAAGFTEEQAEVPATALKTIVENDLATTQDIAEVKRDIKELEVAMKRDIKELEAAMERNRAELKRNIQEMELRLRRDLTLRLGGILVVGIGIIATLIKLPSFLISKKFEQ